MINLIEKRGRSKEPKSSLNVINTNSSGGGPEIINNKAAKEIQPTSEFSLLGEKVFLEGALHCTSEMDYLLEDDDVRKLERL